MIRVGMMGRARGMMAGAATSIMMLGDLGAACAATPAGNGRCGKSVWPGPGPIAGFGPQPHAAAGVKLTRQVGRHKKVRETEKTRRSAVPGRLSTCGVFCAGRRGPRQRQVATLVASTDIHGKRLAVPEKQSIANNFDASGISDWRVKVHVSQPHVLCDPCATLSAHLGHRTLKRDGTPAVQLLRTMPWHASKLCKMRKDRRPVV